jgi:hypothetical protein
VTEHIPAAFALETATLAPVNAVKAKAEFFKNPRRELISFFSTAHLLAQHLSSNSKLQN